MTYYQIVETADNLSAMSLAERARPRATMAADAFAALREAIMLGELKPGTPLRLEELARSLGMSISPVREALRLLEVQGLAEYAPYRGARVTDLAQDEMIEIYEARRALEVPIARRAAARFTNADRIALEAALERAEQGYAIGDRLLVVRSNSDFHSGLAAASGSQWLQRLLSPLLEISERYAAAVLGSDQPAKTRKLERKGHLRILKALSDHDADAAESEILQHLDVFEAHYGGGLAQAST
jgi:DNA-binding GntR family transcriptional regulator